MTFHIDPGRLLRLLVAGAVLLSAANVVHKVLRLRFDTILGGFTSRFDIGAEGTVGAWFGALLLALAAALLWSAGTAAARDGSGHVVAWRLLAVVFVVLSIDEVAAFHEWSGDRLAGVVGDSGPLYHSWVVGGIAFAGAVGVASIRLILDLAAPIRRTFLLAAVVYVGGAVGLEVMGGLFEQDSGPTAVSVATFTAVEELCEMAGVIIFIWGLLRLLADGSAPAPLDRSEVGGEAAPALRGA